VRSSTEGLPGLVPSPRSKAGYEMSRRQPEELVPNQNMMMNTKVSNLRLSDYLVAIKAENVSLL
jgi:hypothetical protein